MIHLYFLFTDIQKRVVNQSGLIGIVSEFYVGFSCKVARLAMDLLVTHWYFLAFAMMSLQIPQLASVFATTTDNSTAAIPKFVQSVPSPLLPTSHSTNKQAECKRDASNSSGCDGHLDKKEKIPLYIGGFFDMGTNGNWDGSGILPAVEMALEHVNERRGLLDDYELRMEWADSEV